MKAPCSLAVFLFKKALQLFRSSPLLFFYNPCRSRSNRCVKAGGTSGTASELYPTSPRDSSWVSESSRHLGGRFTGKEPLIQIGGNSNIFPDFLFCLFAFFKWIYFVYYFFVGKGRPLCISRVEYNWTWCWEISIKGNGRHSIHCVSCYCRGVLPAEWWRTGARGSHNSSTTSTQQSPKDGGPPDSKRWNVLGWHRFFYEKGCFENRFLLGWHFFISFHVYHVILVPCYF